MAKLITAKEAFALSTSTEDLDRHIDYINYQVRIASSHGFRTIEVELIDCRYATAVRIAARLRAAGYVFKWHKTEDDRVWITLSWEGAQ